MDSMHERIDEKKLSSVKGKQEEALKLHAFYRGKIEITPRCRIKDIEDLSVWYSPGVAAPARDIAENPREVYTHTNKGNTVAIVTDGSRVLGLGNIGPKGALPVMEGKALLFKYLGGVDAIPLCINTENPEEIIKFCRWIEPGFGAISLEDIEKPKCFTIVERLREELDIPVWHDDQLGTATVTLAAIINSLKLVGKNKKDVKISMIGAGSANVTIFRLMTEYGFPPQNIVVVDTRGIIYRGREDIKNPENVKKREIAEVSNREDIRGSVPEAMKDADICIAFSMPGPGIIKKEWVSSMASDAIVIAGANPIPEIWPWEAKEAGARVVATGRSDFPNQVNNSLVFPAILRGALDVMATEITDGMAIAAAEEVAGFAQEKGISEEYIIPTMEDWDVYPREAAAVGIKAMNEKVARVKKTREELIKNATMIIKRARKETEVLMNYGIIPMPAEESEKSA